MPGVVHSGQPAAGIPPEAPTGIAGRDRAAVLDRSVGSPAGSAPAPACLLLCALCRLAATGHRRHGGDHREHLRGATPWPRPPSRRGPTGRQPPGSADRASARAGRAPVRRRLDRVGMLCAVSFERYGRLYYADPGELRPAVGDRVLLPTDDDPVGGECVWAAQWVSDDTEGFPRLLGLAGPDDLTRDATIRRKKADARVGAKRLIREHGLPMKVVGVDYLPGPNRTTVYFTAPHRVDFRSLVRDLGATLKCRVELRQLSARDEARVQGGIGSCRRRPCCAPVPRGLA